MNFKKIYREIAKRDGETVVQVRKNINQAIHAAYTSECDAETKAFQDLVPRKGKIPTDEELIRFAVDQLQKEK